MIIKYQAKLQEIITCIRQSNLTDDDQSMIIVWITQLTDMMVTGEKELDRFHSLAQKSPHVLKVLACMLSDVTETYFKKQGSREYYQLDKQLKDFIKLA